jgi:hypothetical protein
MSTRVGSKWCVGIVSAMAAVAAACSGTVARVNEIPDGGGGIGIVLPDAGTTTDRGPGSGQAGSADSGTPDSGIPTAPSDDSSTGTCAAADVASFVPSWKPPKAHADACTQAQIDAYLQDCLGSAATSQTCAPFQSGAGRTCAQCILSHSTDPQLGPLVSDGNYVTANIAGCIALATHDSTGAGCGGKLEAIQQCESAACTANCPVTDDASEQALNDCTEASDTGGCATYAAAAECVNVLDAGTAVARCLSGQSVFETGYAAIVPIFCLIGETP